MARRRWLLLSHSPLGSTFFKRRTSSLHLSIWPPNHHTINSYYPQDVRPPPRRRATPIISRTRQLPPARLRNIADAFRDDVRDCTEYTGMGWAAAASTSVTLTPGASQVDGRPRSPAAAPSRRSSPSARGRYKNPSETGFHGRQSDSGPRCRIRMAFAAKPSG